MGREVDQSPIGTLGLVPSLVGSLGVVPSLPALLSASRLVHLHACALAYEPACLQHLEAAWPTCQGDESPSEPLLAFRVAHQHVFPPPPHLLAC